MAPLYQGSKLIEIGPSGNVKKQEAVKVGMNGKAQARETPNGTGPTITSYALRIYDIPFPSASFNKADRYDMMQGTAQAGPCTRIYIPADKKKPPPFSCLLRCLEIFFHRRPLRLS